MNLEFHQHIFDICLYICVCQILRKSVQGETSCSMRTDGQEDSHDKAESSFPQFYERAQIFYVLPTRCIYMSSLYLRTSSDNFPI